MGIVEELEAQIDGLRKRFDAVFERRLKYLTDSGYLETAVLDACDNPDYEMEALEDWIDELRTKLITLKPEKYHFGRVLKSSHAKVKGTKYSEFGDNGFYVCNECKGLFKFGAYTKEKKFGNEKESFGCCEEHRGRKAEGKMVLKMEMDLAL